jgi:hypothetical protein
MEREDEVEGETNVSEVETIQDERWPRLRPEPHAQWSDGEVLSLFES